MTGYNCYVATNAASEQEAREICAKAVFAASLDDFKLVHTEPPEDPEEVPMYIFAFWADVIDDEGDRLSDYYILPDLPDLPYEYVTV